MEDKVAGNLLIIGGNEDKIGDCVILRRFVAMSGGREARIAVITTATENPREVGDEYRSVFETLGVESVAILCIATRQAANERQLVQVINESTGLFFTGGEQLRITSILGGSLIDEAIKKAYERKVVIAGTSAGASVMSDTMIVQGDSNDTAKRSGLSMAHGLGLLQQVVIDQHFAQRGRINRLLAVVAQNPNVVGMGVDEDTAIVISDNAVCEIVGSQTVTIVDGKSIIFSNISEAKADDPLAIMDVTIHILPSGYRYDLKRRLPYNYQNNKKTEAKK